MENGERYVVNLRQKVVMEAHTKNSIITDLFRIMVSYTKLLFWLLLLNLCSLILLENSDDLENKKSTNLKYRIIFPLLIPCVFIQEIYQFSKRKYLLPYACSSMSLYYIKQHELQILLL